MSQEDQPGTTPDLRDLITLKQAAEISGISYSHLRLLARRGDIWAIRLGNSWFTTAEAVTAYTSEVHNPGPKPGAGNKSTSEDS